MIGEFAITVSLEKGWGTYTDGGSVLIALPFLL